MDPSARRALVAAATAQQFMDARARGLIPTDSRLVTRPEELFSVDGGELIVLVPWVGRRWQPSVHETAETRRMTIVEVVT